MGIDRPSSGSDSAPDRPREPEHPVPRRENPAARDRPPTPQPADAPTTRPDRASDAEEQRLARIARRAEGAPPSQAPPPEARLPEARPEAGRGPRPGDKGVITHFHGPTVDLYTDGTRWASGDVVRFREAERERREGRPEVPSMREHGRDTIGVRPDDAADLPPERKELLESDDGDRSVKDKLRRRIDDDEVFGDLHDAIHDESNLVARALDARQPQGHPVHVQRDSPHIGAVQYGHPSAGDIAIVGLVVGITLDRGVQVLRNMLNHRKEVD